MKKLTALLLVFALCAGIVGCTGLQEDTAPGTVSEASEEQTETGSLKFVHGDKECVFRGYEEGKDEQERQDDLDFMCNMGPDLCNNAYIDGDDMVLVLTEEQRINQLYRMYGMIEEWVAKYLDGQNEKYEIIQSPDYKESVLTFDEHVDPIKLGWAMASLSSGYAYMQLFMDPDAEYHVHVILKNCNNGRLIGEFVYPDEAPYKVSPEEIMASYE